MTTKINEIQFTRINNNSDGNPRYVCHWLNLLKESEKFTASGTYEVALNRSHKIGGRKFHNKQYGGGIVFSCLEPNEIQERINTVLS